MHADLCSKGLRLPPAGDRELWCVPPFLPAGLVLLLALALVALEDLELVPRARQATLCSLLQIPLLFQQLLSSPLSVPWLPLLSLLL